MSNILYILALLIIVAVILTDFVTINDMSKLDIKMIKLKLDIINDGFNKVEFISISRNKIVFKCKNRIHEVHTNPRYIKLRIGRSMESLSKYMYIDHFRFDIYMNSLYSHSPLSRAV